MAAFFKAAQAFIQTAKTPAESKTAFLERVAPLLARVITPHDQRSRGFSRTVVSRWVYDGITDFNVEAPQPVAIARVAWSFLGDKGYDDVPSVWKIPVAKDILDAFGFSAAVEPKKVKEVEPEKEDDCDSHIYLIAERHALPGQEGPLTGLVKVGQTREHTVRISPRFAPRFIEHRYRWSVPISALDHAEIVAQSCLPLPVDTSREWFFLPPAPPDWKNELYPTSWIENPHVQTLMEHYLKIYADEIGRKLKA